MQHFLLNALNPKVRNDKQKCDLISTGVAIGAGWQSIVAYVNIGCYYIIGIPVGIVLGNVIHWQVKVGFYNPFCLRIAFI